MPFRTAWARASISTVVPVAILSRRSGQQSSHQSASGACDGGRRQETPCHPSSRPPARLARRASYVIPTGRRMAACTRCLRSPEDPMHQAAILRSRILRRRSPTTTSYSAFPTPLFGLGLVGERPGHRASVISLGQCATEEIPGDFRTLQSQYQRPDDRRDLAGRRRNKVAAAVLRRGLQRRNGDHQRSVPDRARRQCELPVQRDAGKRDPAAGGGSGKPGRELPERHRVVLVIHALDGTADTGVGAGCSRSRRRRARAAPTAAASTQTTGTAGQTTGTASAPSTAASTTSTMLASASADASSVMAAAAGSSTAAQPASSSTSGASVTRGNQVFTNIGCQAWPHQELHHRESATDGTKQRHHSASQRFRRA